MQHVQMKIDTDTITDEAVREVVDEMLSAAQRDYEQACKWVQDEARKVASNLTKIATEMAKAEQFQPWNTGGIPTSTERFEHWVGRMEAARHAIGTTSFFATRLGATRMPEGE